MMTTRNKRNLVDLCLESYDSTRRDLQLCRTEARHLSVSMP